MMIGVTAFTSINLVLGRAGRNGFATDSLCLFVPGILFAERVLFRILAHLP